jgi:energy-coupling factor transporter ATP-binding protein EcfA2
MRRRRKECLIERIVKMGVKIRSIHIENFRSITNLDAQLSQLAIFVGKNDCGKSNIFRALNLFFNDETNPGVDLDFDEDYNFFAPHRKQRAKEIVIRLEIDLPETYRSTNGDLVIWTKRWRKDGLWGEERDYHGVRISKSKRGSEKREIVEISDKSNLHSLLRKIDFEYVPAVKDAQYFDDLRGRIYGIISDVAARTFHDSSTAFETAIGDHLGELTTSITTSLGFETRLALPRDLYHIFERLDFLSGEKSVSLNNRGDGIKARHIPLILKFMAEKKAELQRRGGSPISSIWAYEEPENNLEMASAVQLADELDQLAMLGTAQILLTTHSPAFYDLGQREERVELNFVTRLTDADGTTIKPETAGIDESLGTLAMLAPRISEMVAQVREQETARHDAEQLAKENCAKIFVEGESDKLIFERAVAIYFPNAVGNVSFETKRDGAGHNYVVDMLNAWRSQHKHHPDRPKAVGLLDADAAASKTAFNKHADNVKSAKCICFPAPQQLHGALAAGFKIPITLETLYPQQIWKNALKKGHLKKRQRRDVYPDSLIDKLLSDPAQDHGLNDDWRIFIEYDFEDLKKVSTARQLVQADDDKCKQDLANFEPVLREALQYLGLADI